MKSNIRKNNTINRSNIKVRNQDKKAKNYCKKINNREIL